VFSRDHIVAKLGDANYRVLRGIFLVFVFMVLGRLAGLLKEMVIAYRHGVGEVVDIYVFGFVVVSWIPVIFQSIGQSILVPLFSKLDETRRGAFFTELLLVTLLAGAMVCLVIFVFAGDFIRLLAPGFSYSAVESAELFARVISPSVVLLMLVTVFSAELLAKEQHANTLTEAVPAIVLFLFVLAWPVSRPPLEPFAFGTLAGLFCQLIILILISRPQITTGIFTSADQGSVWRDVAAALSVLGVGAMIMAIAKPVDQIVAARFGEGGVSTLSYASRVLALGIGLGTTMVTRALLPVLSDGGQSDSARLAITRQWTLIMFFTGVVGAAIVWWFVPPVVGLLFERGAFTSHDTLAVSSLVRYGLLQIPFILVGMVVVQLFTSIRDYKTVAISGVVGAIVKVLTVLPLASMLGLPGVMLSSAIMYLSTFLYLLFQYRAKRHSLQLV
jgi:peptidoglycan biosynthesis protein MviN/MurJ (putative lipid II flippase)